MKKYPDIPAAITENMIVIIRRRLAVSISAPRSFIQTHLFSRFVVIMAPLSQDFAEQPFSALRQAAACLPLRRNHRLFTNAIQHQRLLDYEAIGYLICIKVSPELYHH